MSTRSLFGHALASRAKCLRWLAVFFIATLPLVLGAASSSPPQDQGATHNQLRSGYLGDAGCTSCHRRQALSYLRTAHHLTSQLPDTQSIHGPLAPPANSLTIVAPENTLGEPSLQFRMEHIGDRFYQTAITGFSGQLQQRRESIDLVIGSGKRGQTYLYWQDDHLFELPVSYWTDGHRWINSPGYDDGTANFSRPIYPACMECHTSYIRALSNSPDTNSFERSSFVPGIGCETCHGPGARHAAIESTHAPRTAKIADSAILNPTQFSRERQIDLCALCHNGIQREPIAPAFSYIPGQPLSNYFKPLISAPIEHPDVHGNQVGLLERSRCFLDSATMTCSTCHNTHEPERTAASYSQKCLDCHKWQQCGEARRIGVSSKTRCIDCHMPIEPTKVIVSTTAGTQVHATMRNHWIKVYPGTPEH
jgi:hypothetical protein